MAELIAILKAVTHEARRGETGRHIYTDSLNSLHGLQWMIHSPHTMSAHEYRDILTLILKEATSKKDYDGQPKKKLTLGWMVYGERRHAEPQREDVPSRLYPW